MYLIFSTSVASQKCITVVLKVIHFSFSNILVAPFVRIVEFTVVENPVEMIHK